MLSSVEGSRLIRDISPDSFTLRAGAANLIFCSCDEQPVHHFAFQVPGNRFGAAQAWLSERATLQSMPAQRDPTFVFDNIDALASYVLDPAGNIVELIAYNDLDALDREGAFSPVEFVGIAEGGMVVSDRHAAARILADHAVPVWSGVPDEDPSAVRRTARVLNHPGLSRAGLATH